jgi:hypothetical protein
MNIPRKYPGDVKRFVCVKSGQSSSFTVHEHSTYLTIKPVFIHRRLTAQATAQKVAVPKGADQGGSRK